MRIKEQSYDTRDKTVEHQERVSLNTEVQPQSTSDFVALKLSVQRCKGKRVLSVAGGRQSIVRQWNRFATVCNE